MVKALIVLWISLLCTAHAETWNCNFEGFSRAEMRSKSKDLKGNGYLSCESATGFKTDLPFKVVLNTDHNAVDTKLEDIKVSLLAENFAIGSSPDRIVGNYSVDGESPTFKNAASVELLLRNSDRSLQTFSPVASRQRSRARSPINFAAGPCTAICTS